METAQKLRRRIGRAIRTSRRTYSDGVGHSFLKDVKARLPHLEIRTIFDVGANIGMTAMEFSDEFPEAVVHAFEPGTENFRLMQLNLVGKPEVVHHRIGFSDEAGDATLLIEPEHPTMARLAADETDEPSETIVLDTVDHFCASNGIDRIDFMKIDTEGHELPVLAGAKGMLARHAIGLIKMEAAIDPDSSYHTQLFDIVQIMHPHGYRLFGFYDQWEDTIVPDHPRLRRFDVAFISPSIGRRPPA